MITRNELVSWLLHNEFEKLPNGSSGHAQYKHAPSGVKVTVQAHGRRELTRKQLGLVVRQLEAAGFGREAVRRELGGPR